MDEVSVRLPAAPPAAYRRYVAWLRAVAELASSEGPHRGGDRPPLDDAGALRALPAEQAADLEAQVDLAEREGLALTEPVLSGDVTLWLLAVGYGERTMAWVRSLPEDGAGVPQLDPEMEDLWRNVQAAIRAALEAADVTLHVVPEETPGSFRLIGELDMSHADMLTEALETELAMGNRLTLDLSGLTFMDSTGIRLLISLGRGAQSAGLDPVVIVSPSAAVLHILHIALPSGVPGVEIRDEPTAPAGHGGPGGLMFFTL